MSDLVIRPTKKWIRFQYTTVFILLILCFFVWSNYLQATDGSAWIFVIPALLFLKPLRDQFLRHFTKITVSGDKFTYETGMLSKTVRTIQLSRVQDVTVHQSLGQRLVGIGNLSIETAGETSLLTIANIDEPRAVADEIVAAAHAQPQRRRDDEDDGGSAPKKRRTERA